MALKKLLMAGVSAFLLSAGLSAQDAPAQTIETLRGGLHVVFAQAGNVGVSAGEDGVFLIDDQYAPMTPALKNIVSSVSDGPIRYVINTHFHGDHSGGNENLGNEGTVMVAHDNVRQRLKAGTFIKVFNMDTPPAKKAALPSVTFNSEMSLHLNGDEARIIHVEDAHTDGDSMVYFKGADVLFTGDIVFFGLYPFIDVEHGGSIGGMIAAVDRAVGWIGEETQVVPGHGPVTDRAGLVSYGDFLKDTRNIISGLKAEGKSLEDIVEMNPFAKYDGKVGGFNADWKNQYAGFVYNSLK